MYLWMPKKVKREHLTISKAIQKKRKERKIPSMLFIQFLLFTFPQLNTFNPVLRQVSIVTYSGTVIRMSTSRNINVCKLSSQPHLEKNIDWHSCKMTPWKVYSVSTGLCCVISYLHLLPVWLPCLDELELNFLFINSPETNVTNHI